MTTHLIGLLVDARLGAGVHEFVSLAEVFEKLGIEQVGDGTVRIRRCSESGLMAAKGTVLKMSYRRFCGVVHRLDSVRLQTSPRWQVERDGAARHRVVVGSL